ESAAVREALDFKPDLIHVHYVTGFGLWGIRSRFSPTVVSVWGSDLMMAEKEWFRKRITIKALSQAQHITATSHFLKKQTARISPRNTDKITIIPFGVTPIMQVEPLPPISSLRLCYIKSHKSVYGPDVLLKAMAIVKPELPNLMLSLAGHGNITRELRMMVNELDLTDSVNFVGFVKNSDIYDFISRHHVMVMPSRREAFGVAALETGICGRPVIATNVGGIPEVVHDNKTGLLVPPDDPEALAKAIMKLGKNTDQIKRMGDEGHDFVRDNFSWDQSLDKMTDLYERLIYEASQA
ncbi:MAG: glycosyltransferase family 4 protein, partial [candidate division Zixibacteria bacterium]|nr:glycosyltransferase family 4 protein [candidate division Zixibacteria bacterium]